ncbi:hypothetical protein C8R41DRAFT_605878 [Lentinula lateritia]|uniref:Uncharacterized protein n=1 Tax=Lentinula lateritia TaxID=40482 RepID=A0ABQ8VUQ5_9AGAR|nr:hypothetical protein C8R41DRAFT_605878 [Lentinula lateritia]
MVYTRTVLGTLLVVGNAFVFAAPVSESNTGGLSTSVPEISLRSNSGPGREDSSNSGGLKNNKCSSPQHGSPNSWSPASTATGLESLDREDSLAPYDTPTNPPDQSDPHPASNSNLLIDSNTLKEEIKHNLVGYGSLRERAQELLSNEHPLQPQLWNIFLAIICKTCILARARILAGERSPATKAPKAKIKACSGCFRCWEVLPSALSCFRLFSRTYRFCR